VLVDMIDLGANLQLAGDAARFQHAQDSNTLELESQLYALVGAQLTARGHKVVKGNGDDMGGYQAILHTETPSGGYYRAAIPHPHVLTNAYQPTAAPSLRWSEPAR